MIHVNKLLQQHQSNSEQYSVLNTDIDVVTIFRDIIIKQTEDRNLLCVCCHPQKHTVIITKIYYAQTNSLQNYFACKNIFSAFEMSQILFHIFSLSPCIKNSPVGFHVDSTL